MKQKNVQLEALIDSKKEYMEHLFDLMTEPMVMTFQEIYQDCLNAPETRKKGILNSFQDALTAIASWNHHLIKEHYEKIMAHTGCKYIPELIRALISVQVKINLLANSKSLSADNIKLKIPSAENFVHRFYIDVARGIWKRPYLLYHNVRSVEKQQNLLDLEKLIQQTIRITLRGYVPMEQLIANMHLNDVPMEEEDTQTDSGDDGTESETSSESESESEEDEVPDTESDVESDAESIVEVVELPEELQNEVVITTSNNVGEAEKPNAEEETVENNQIDITVLHEESSEEDEVGVDDVIADVATAEDVAVSMSVEPTMSVDQQEESFEDVEEIRTDPSPVEMKNVEFVETIVEPDSPNIHVNKAPEVEETQTPPPNPMPIQELPRPEVEDRTSPFNMMIMNRKIITHRPPTSMVIKKKKRDAFF